MEDWKKAIITLNREMGEVRVEMRYIKRIMFGGLTYVVLTEQGPGVLQFLSGLV